ncbi:MAG: outer membrane protein assembly factor BamD [Candidatus Acidiferrales bacterium]
MTRRTPALLATAFFLAFVPAGCVDKDMAAKMPAAGSAQPDKILFDRALGDYQHGRYTEARLSLQTLINSYPDSEYLAKAKLAVADSYYKEGGVEGLTQAVAEYKDFETFFPFLPEASYAQMQVGMAHYRMMEKADRDDTQAELAEEEFQAFLLKYPKDPLVPEAEQRLREVQELLAEADFDVAHFYYLKGDYRASASRLIEVAGRYPLFSESDRALWMLGDIYRRASRGSKNEQERVRWRTQSDVEYAKLLKYYPLSPLAADAKRQLTGDGIPIPPPDPQALARAQYEEKLAQDHPGMTQRAMGLIKSSPNVSAAAHSGEPNLNPPGEMSTSEDVLQGGTTSSVGIASSAGSSPGQTVSVETVSPTESSSTPPGSSTAPPVDPPSASSSTTTVAATSAATTATVAATPAALAGIAPTKLTETATDAAVATELKVGAASKKKPAKKTKPLAKSKPAKAPKADKSTESTSQKKKGIHKLIPW